jgi:hypothetical protein
LILPDDRDVKAECVARILLLIINNSGISKVHRLRELFKFKRLSEDDLIIQMQLDSDP